MPQLLALALVAGLFAAACYRAVALGVTVDEAYTYTQFVARPLGAAMTDFDANNHVLYTLLARVSVAVFGAGDLALRGPGLLAAAIFYSVLFRLMARLVGGEGWLWPLAVAVVGANTYIVDLLPLARGYGLALAFFALGLMLALEERPNEWAVGAAFGLCASSNLTFLFPMVGLMVALRSARAAAAMAGVAGLLLAVPLWHSSREHFYYGADSPFTSAVSLAGVIVERNRSEQNGWVMTGIAVMAAVLVLAVAMARRTRALALLGASVAGGAVLLVGGHYAGGLLYPYGRTGIAWVLLFTLCLMALASLGSGWAAGVAGVAALCLICYARTWSISSTVEWDSDAGTRDVAEWIAAQPRANRVRIAAGGGLPHTLNYYRHTRGWTWMEDVKLGDLRSAQKTFDYWVVTPGEDREWAAAQGMKALFEHKVSGTAVMAR